MAASRALDAFCGCALLNGSNNVSCSLVKQDQGVHEEPSYYTLLPLLVATRSRSAARHALKPRFWLLRALE